jgi:hypothetical protein
MAFGADVLVSSLTVRLAEDTITTRGVALDALAG